MVVSPTTTRTASEGWNRDRYQRSTSARVMAETDAFVPEPEAGFAYGCPSP